MKRVDLTGQTFGDWKVIKYLGNKKYLCRCSCGVEKEVATYKLTNGQSKSCGHNKNKFIDLTGQIFGEWEVLNYYGDHKWNCRCSCGKIKTVNTIYLRNGKSKSCGHDTTGYKDITGQRFGDWLAIKPVGKTLWECECQCKNKIHRNVKLYDLLNGKSKSCGHDTTRFIDLTGQKFGEWTVLEYNGDEWWLCKCSCGTYSLIKSQRLRDGRTKSCGCKILEHTIKHNLEKFGVKYCGQRHRTPYEIDITYSKENMQNFIKSNWKYKPTVNELAQAINLQIHRTLVYIHKYELEDLVNIKPNISRYEEEINKLFPCDSKSDRKTLNGKEIDLLYIDKNIGIEFNGTYWHSTIFKDKKYHQNKSLEALKNGIRLIHIFEYEWNDSDMREKLINLLNREINNQTIKIYARDCEINTINNKEEIEFLDKYHLQGYAASSIKYGCYYNNELIGVMTFKKPRFNHEYQYELIRLCWKNDISVIGGSEKLFKRFIDEYNPTSIISYCDISKFSGTVYKKLGFKLNEITEPNYKWINTLDNSVLTRYQTQKSQLVAKGLGTEIQTEAEIMYSLGYIKIYDCGNYRYVWTN